MRHLLAITLTLSFFLGLLYLDEVLKSEHGQAVLDKTSAVLLWGLVYLGIYQLISWCFP